MWAVFDLVADLAEELLDDFLDQLDRKDVETMPVVCLLLVIAAVVLHAL